MKFLIACITIILATTLAMTAYAQEEEVRELEVEFSYAPAHEDFTAVGFKMYANGGELCETSDVNAGPPMALICDAASLAPGEYDFTMTALYQNGNESPKSAAYPFEILPNETSPQIIIIRFR